MKHTRNRNFASLARVLVVVLAVGLTAGGLSADTIRPAAFGVFARNGMDIGQQVNITGGVGSFEYIGVGQDVQIGGDLLGKAYMDINKRTAVGGQVIAYDGLWIGNDAAVGNIQSGSGVSFGKGVSTGSITARGYTGIAQDMAVLGDVRVGGYVNINKGALITGDVYHTGGYWKNKKATVEGEFVSISESPEIDRWEYDEPGRDIHSSKSDWQHFSNNEELYLSPGDYGEYDIGNNAVVHLTAPGEYTFHSLTLGNNAEIIGEGGGDIALNVANDFQVGNNAVIRREADVSSMNLNTDGWTSLGSGAQVEGSIFAYGGGLEIGSNSQIDGVLYTADYLTLGSGSSVAGVPEPATVTVIALGGIVILLRRRE